MEKIIVTGGSGFIGTNLVNFLIKKKYSVINIDKLTYSSNKHSNLIRNKKNYNINIVNNISPMPPTSRLSGVCCASDSLV